MEKFNPFRQTQEQLDQVKAPGVEYHITEIKDKQGRKFLRKTATKQQLWNSKNMVFYDGRFITTSLEELAKERRDFYRALKRHLGDYLVDTEYVIAADENGEPQINLIQPKIEGTTIEEMVRNPEIDRSLPDDNIQVRSYKELKVSPEIMRQLEEIDAIFIEKIQHDPEVKARFNEAPGIKGGGVGERPLHYAYAEVLPAFIPLGATHGSWGNIVVDKNGKLHIVDW